MRTSLGGTVVAPFESSGVTLLLAKGEFETRVGQDGRPLGHYIKALTERLSSSYHDVENVTGVRDLIVALAPTGEYRHWLVVRSGKAAATEQGLVSTQLSGLDRRVPLSKPILFALTYSLEASTLPDAPLAALQLPAEWLDIAKQLGQRELDTEVLLEYLWPPSPTAGGAA